MTSGNLRTIAEIYRHGAIFLSQTVWVFNTFRQQAKENAIKNSLEKWEWRRITAVKGHSSKQVQIDSLYATSY